MSEQTSYTRFGIGLLAAVSITFQLFSLNGARVAHAQDPLPPQVKSGEPDLTVVRFSWVREQQKKSRMIRGAQRPGGLIVNPINTGQDLGSRKVELRTVDKKAVASTDRPAETYQLQLEVMNTGVNLIKGLVWEFKPTAGPVDYQPKRYPCALEVKPKQKKILDFWTPYLPVKVISAKTTDVLKEGTVIIYQIHYADGAVWTKAGWNYKLPADSLQKLAEGNCSWF